MLKWLFKKDDEGTGDTGQQPQIPETSDAQDTASPAGGDLAGRLGSAGRSAWRNLKKELLSSSDTWIGEADSVVRCDDVVAKERLVELIKEAGDKSMVPPLIALTDGHPQKIRQKAVEALGNFAVPDAASCLMERVVDDDPEIRWRSVYSLGFMQEAAAFDLFVKSLDDEVTDVRWRAVWALNRLSDVKAIPHLVRMLKDDFSGVRGAAAEALGDQQAADSIPSLIEALDDKDQGVLWSVIEALGKLRASAAVPSLTHIAETGDPDLQTAAQAALEQIGGA